MDPRLVEAHLVIIVLVSVACLLLLKVFKLHFNCDVLLVSLEDPWLESFLECCLEIKYGDLWIELTSPDRSEVQHVVHEKLQDLCARHLYFDRLVKLDVDILNLLLDVVR